MTVTNKIGGVVAVLGAGNIGLAIAEGIYESGMSDVHQIILTRRNSPFTGQEKLKFQCLYDNKEAVSKADIVILAPQPKQADEVLNEVAEVLEDQLLISVVSGLSIARIEELTGDGPIARAMPNLAIEVGQSMTGLVSNEEGRSHMGRVLAIFNTLGKAKVIEESQFAEMTTFSGSGLAFALRFIEAQVDSFSHLQFGFSEEDALMIAVQVVKGAAMLIEKSQGDLKAKIEKVSTPGGCTVEMLERLREQGFGSVVLSANAACLTKAEQLYNAKK